MNLKSMFLVTQAVLPAMRSLRWGRIVNLSSVAAQLGGVVGPHYAASKAGAFGLTHSYAHLLAKEGITVNAVAPALIETEMELIRSRRVLSPVIDALLFRAAPRDGAAGDSQRVALILGEELPPGRHELVTQGSGLALKVSPRGL